MNFRSGVLSRAALPAFVLLSVLAGSVALQAQTKQIIQWRSDLNYLQGAPADELDANRDAVAGIRTNIEFWLKMHPDSKIELQPAPAQPWGADEIRNQISQLRQAVDTILKEESGQPFDLGVTTISVTAETSPLSPVTDSFERADIINLQALNAAKALDYLPGLAVDNAAARNEAAVRLRGFTSRGQVPLYIDGIPVSMPYDGTIDFNRLLSSDIAEVQVAKGFSSPLLGPNGMGGSINLVTRQPEKKLQSDMLIGTGSGNMLLSSFNIGSRWEKFYIQGGLDWLQSDHFPLPDDYKPMLFQSGYERKNSDTRDAKYSGRIAWTPRSQDQYVFSYANQKAEKGIPLYAGPNENASFGRMAFRRYPYWNKTNYNFITNTGIGESNAIKFRGYYDQFDNAMNFYDDATFSTMNRSSSYSSIYNDHSAGGSLEFMTRALPRNTISASFTFRDDNHKEISFYPSTSRTTPTTTTRAQTFSFGIQDVVTISSRMMATFGFSADYLDGKQAQMLDSAGTNVIAVTCPSDPTNTSFTGCMTHEWNVNPQASLSYFLTPLDTVFVTFADRGRFPLLKEAYTMKLGMGIANPDLKPEHNTALNVGYSHAFPRNTVAQFEFFYNRLRDAIQGVYVVDPGGTSDPICDAQTGVYIGYCSQNVNVAKETHRGMEFSIRSTPISRLTMDVQYSHLYRSMVYDFGSNLDISEVLTTVQILPTYPMDKLVANATVRLPHDILAIVSARYESGLQMQDTTYRNPPQDPFKDQFGTMDLGTVVPVYAGLSAQAGIKNLFDRYYFYTPGYPEPGRSWYLNLRYKF